MATTASDPTVILSIARTPMGAMQGALADASATDLGATAVKAAVERAGVSGEDIDRIYMGCVLPAGLGQAPARQAAIKAGPAQVGPGDHRQQGLRLGHADGDHGRRGDPHRQCRRDRRRRHGVDDQRAVPAQEAPLGRADRPRHRLRPHVPRRARGCLRGRPRDGQLRPVHRRRISADPPADGRLRDREPAPRQGRDRQGRVQGRGRAGHIKSRARARRRSTPTRRRAGAVPTRSRS